jgi:hypothetical protein
MKIIATKYEDLEVEVSEESIEVLMCDILKKDYKTWGDLEMQTAENDLLNAMAIVYEAYSGKPIDLVDRFSH